MGQGNEQVLATLDDNLVRQTIDAPVSSPAPSKASKWRCIAQTVELLSRIGHSRRVVKHAAELRVIAFRKASERTHAQIRELLQFLQSVPGIRSMQPSVQLETAGALEGRYFPPFEEVVSAGTVPHSYCIVLEGECAVVVTHPNGTREQIQAIQPGMSFGDVALLQARAIHGSVITLADTVLLMMEAKNYMRIMSGGTAAEVEAKILFLRSLPHFSDLDKDYVRFALIPTFTEAVFHRNEVLVRQGDPSNTMLLIRSGSAIVYVDPAYDGNGEDPPSTDPEQCVQVCLLGVGTFIGDMSLHQDAGAESRRTSTVIALTAVECYITTLREFRRRMPSSTLQRMQDIAEQKHKYTREKVQETVHIKQQVERAFGQGVITIGGGAGAAVPEAVLKGHSLRALMLQYPSLGHCDDNGTAKLLPSRHLSLTPLPTGLAASAAQTTAPRRSLYATPIAAERSLAGMSAARAPSTWSGQSSSCGLASLPALPHAVHATFDCALPATSYQAEDPASRSKELDRIWGHTVEAPMSGAMPVSGGRVSNDKLGKQDSMSVLASSILAERAAAAGPMSVMQNNTSAIRQKMLTQRLLDPIRVHIQPTDLRRPAVPDASKFKLLPKLPEDTHIETSARSSPGDAEHAAAEEKRKKAELATDIWGISMSQSFSLRGVDAEPLPVT